MGNAHLFFVGVQAMLKKGKGWRIGWQDKAEIYQGLIGADDWAFEVSASEMEDFCRLLAEITDTMKAMAEHLMEEESISCEVESPLLWLGAEGYVDNYRLRIIFNQGRGVEGAWESDAVQGLVQGVQSLKSF
ncbi:protein of unknown function DUF1818 [Cyanobacterium stanieri PCC 7202]|uniref:DUF1818 domain-containing protein n=1 Tax=Cyanobacterium stanieri (strain ATCC 29140 / PCC 7202) TaxID=292563 RepID=K9YND7_CYASC|nr:protein of unknown function DUF1818 [Cyanobacterium stanieri PCC 7202]